MLKFENHWCRMWILLRESLYLYCIGRRSYRQKVEDMFSQGFAWPGSMIMATQEAKVTEWGDSVASAWWELQKVQPFLGTLQVADVATRRRWPLHSLAWTFRLSRIPLKPCRGTVRHSHPQMASWSPAMKPWTGEHKRTVPEGTWDPTSEYPTLGETLMELELLGHALVVRGGGCDISAIRINIILLDWGSLSYRWNRNSSLV